MLIAALIATVGLIISMGFFMMGSLPLLVLQHDTPLDGRFIRGLFNVYYRAVAITGACGALGYTLAGRPLFAAVLGGMAALGLAGRQWFIPRMDALRNVITAENATAIRAFRRLHIQGMLINFVMLIGFCYGMTRTTL